MPAVVVILLALLALALLAGCDQKMRRQPKYKPLAASEFFADGKSARAIMPDTVARGSIVQDKVFATGKTPDKKYTVELPFAATRVVLAHGQGQFNTFCSPCHSRLGNGDGMIVRRGLSRPPSFHDDRLLTSPVGYFYDVATNGFGRMQGYATQVPPRDRWTICAYIRALQLSQHAKLAELPEADRRQIENPPLSPDEKPAAEGGRR